MLAELTNQLIVAADVAQFRPGFSVPGGSSLMNTGLISFWSYQLSRFLKKLRLPGYWKKLNYFQ